MSSRDFSSGNSSLISLRESVGEASLEVSAGGKFLGINSIAPDDLDSYLWNEAGLSKDNTGRLSNSERGGKAKIFTYFERGFAKDILKKDFSLTKTVKIPKIIMQTWKTRDVPAHWKPSPVSIKKHMPDWTYILMSDEDNDKFCKKYFPAFWPFFKKFPHPIMRADCIRYMFLYIYGGIYMDLDIVVKKPLDNLFFNDADLYLTNSANVGSCLTNCFMASKPGCSLWLDLIEHTKQPAPYYAFGKHLEVMNVTGPLALTKVVKDKGYTYLNLATKYVVPCDVCTVNDANWKDDGEIDLNLEEAYLTPLKGSSWIGWDTKIYLYCMCKWDWIVLFILIFILVIIVIYIAWKLVGDTNKEKMMNMEKSVNMVENK